eukprot:c21101_g1_i1 orf=321-5741(+)
MMSLRRRSSCHGQFDTLIAPREQKRRSPSSRQDENPGFLQVCMEKPSACKNGADGRGSSLESRDRRGIARQLRRPFFDMAHLRPSVCTMAHVLPTCASSSGRKRSLDYRELGNEMGEKKHKLYILNSDPASAKSRRSKEMVSHKYRTVDSIQRSGVSNASSLEKHKSIELPEIKSRRSSRINKDEVEEINGVGPSSSIGSHRKGSLSSYEGPLEDWTQEHLREPRKIEKRKSLLELQATEGSLLVSWTKKARRRLRKGERIASVGVERVRSPHSDKRSAGPEEEIRKSSSGSEALKLHVASDGEENEQVCSKLPSDSQREFDLIDQRLLLTGNGSVQHIKDTVGASKEETGNSQLVEVTSTLCHSVASEKLLNAGLNNDLQPFLKGSDRVKASNNHHDVSCSPHDGSDIVKPLCGHELSKTFVPPGKEGESLPLFKEKESSETLVACGFLSKEEEIVVCTDKGEVRLNLAEGRRCGLCGGDSKGEPPNYLLPVSTKQKGAQNIGCDRISPEYSEWDAFGNEPGWLGPLLGPLDDRFGIAGVWVHQECAIWSPEVYFAGLGHIKNIRAALRRGKLLKCTRCTRPGATIGCRIERCPRTYHLPCARFDGCFFDHKKFLMACGEHLHHFLPRLPGHRRRRNSLNLGRIRFKRKVGEWKKMAQRAGQLDTEAEEKWQEKAGVDEEFLRRERKRFQRDITRVAPVMVGGGSEQHMPEGWESIAGSDNVVQCMKEMVILPLLYPEAFTRLGVSPPRGVLLHGHPGTGKTLAVKALVGACAKGHKRIAYFARKGADCLGKYAGDAERQLRMLFYLAEKHQPSIIFFDEIDGLAPTRSQHQDQTQKSVVSTLLALMDGVKSRGSVVVIGATNRPDDLDPALRRPGRFDREIYFPLPSFVDRTAILTLLTKNWQLPQKDDTISLLASRTIGFAGADLQALCAQAAINSLTRFISVEDMMALVEKQGVSKIPPLPELTVSLTDWATALEQVSPPCSWRSAKAAVNIVTCAPVSHHILPVLLWPMVKLLVSLHLDDRVILPPILDKVATSLEETLKSNVGGSWIDHIDFFLHDTMSSSPRKQLELDLEGVFSIAGMVSHQKVMPVTPNIAYTGSKFRVMVSGKERSWLDHFAAWLLFGFEGFVEMCNLNLTTMLQEGGGDVVEGLIHILGNVRNKNPCVVYMPQMESWAVEPVARNSGEEPVEEQRQASHYWSIFLQQVNLLPASLQIVFMASSEMRKDDIPQEIVDFFVGTPISSSLNTYNASGRSPFQEMWMSFDRCAPCSWVESYVAPDMKMVFSRAADDFAELLCQRLLSHGKSGNRTCTTELRKSDKQVLFLDKQQAPCERSPSCGSMDTGHDHAVGKDVNAERPIISAANLNEAGFNAVFQEQFTPSISTEIKSAYAPGGQPNAPRPPEQNHMSVAISMVGYQLLYHPELRELRHATSKLQEGPSFTTRTYKKKTSSESSDSSNSQRDHVNLLDLKGLNAVGLLAYSGTYLKAKDVAWGVREVLELLMKRIDIKVNLGKDREQFSHLLHQAAALEDKIFTWAYNLRRCDVVPIKTGSTVKEVLPPKWKTRGECEVLAVETLTVHEKEFKALNCTQNPSSSNFTNINEALSGSEVNAPVSDNVKKSEISVLHGNSSGSEELQRGTLPINGSENQKSQLKATTDGKVNEEMGEVHIVASSARKCCPDSRHQAKQALRKSFVNSWRCRGSEVSLNVADEVIGTCSSAVSAALNRLLNSDTQGILHSAISSCNSGCLCRANHNQTMIAPVPMSDDSRKKGKLLTTTEPVDLDKGSLSTLDYVCLCPFIKQIFDLK